MYSVFIGESYQNDDNYAFCYLKINFHTFKTVESAWDWVLRITNEEPYPYDSYCSKERDESLEFEPIWEAIDEINGKIYLIFKTSLE